MARGETQCRIARFTSAARRSVQGCPQLLEQRPAIAGAAQPVNSGDCSPPVYRSGVSELTTINKPDRTFITHSDRLLTFTANGNTFTTDDRFTRFAGPKHPCLINQSQERET